MIRAWLASVPWTRICTSASPRLNCRLKSGRMRTIASTFRASMSCWARGIDVKSCASKYGESWKLAANSIASGDGSSKTTATGAFVTCRSSTKARWSGSCRSAISLSSGPSSRASRSRAPMASSPPLRSAGTATPARRSRSTPRVAE